VGGISAQIREAENMQRLLNYVEMAIKAPFLMKYNKPYELNKEIVQAIGFRNPSFLMDETERDEADQKEAQAEAEMKQVQDTMIKSELENEQIKTASDANAKDRKADVAEFKAYSDAMVKGHQAVTESKKSKEESKSKK